MIHEQTNHLTALDAESKGESFKSALGWGYDATYRVYYNATDDVWVCETSRMKELKDKFIEHAALIWRQEGVTVEQAGFMAWGEGPAGYMKRLEAEQDGENDDI